MAVPNDSTVRWFHSDMAGAPQLNKQDGDYVAVFDACLINGFGVAIPDGNKITVSGGQATVEFSGGHDFEKHAVIEIDGATPAALNDVWRITAATGTEFTFDCPGVPDGVATGSISVKRAPPGYWTKPFEDSTRRAFRSAHPDATGYYLVLTESQSSSSFGVEVRGCEFMTDLDSLSNMFPAGESFCFWQMQYSDRDPDWMVIADAKTIYFMGRWDNEESGGVLHMFGDYVSFSESAANCGITFARDFQSSPGDDCDVDRIGEYRVMYSARDANDNNPGGNHAMSRGSAMQGYFVFGEQPHNSVGRYLFSGPMVLQDYGTNLPRGYEPAFYKCASDHTGLIGHPDAHLNDSFAVLTPQESGGPIMAIVRLASYDYVSDSGCAGLDIEGPWK